MTALADIKDNAEALGSFYSTSFWQMIGRGTPREQVTGALVIAITLTILTGFLLTVVAAALLVVFLPIAVLRLHPEFNHLYPLSTDGGGS